LLDGLQAMHGSGSFHGDVKLDNLLLSDNYEAKLCDFGFSGPVTEKMDRPRGTVGYLSPEFLEGKPYSGVAADLFAAAVVIFILVCGHVPFHTASMGDPRYRLLATGDADGFWEKQAGAGSVSTGFKRMVEVAFAGDVDSRPTLDEYRDAEWMRGPKPSQHSLARFMDQYN
jgi:serine/threonine protein kinase